MFSSSDKPANSFSPLPSHTSAGSLQGSGNTVDTEPVTVFRRKCSTREAAEILGCSRSLIRHLIAIGEIRNVLRPGKRTYVLDRDEIEEYAQRQMVSGL